MEFINRKGSGKRTGNISDRALAKALSMPLQTLYDWKKSKDEDNWRVQIYNFLKKMTLDELSIKLSLKKENVNISDNDLSRATGIPQQTISNWANYKDKDNWRVQLYNLLKNIHS